MRYRKIDPRTWKDEKFCQLTGVEKLIALYILTAQSNRIGIFNFSPAMAAEDLDMKIETFLKGFEKVIQSMKWAWDKHTRVMYIPTWWKYNPPENPNVMKSLLNDLHELPLTSLINQFNQNLTFIPESSKETFKEGCLKVPQTFPKPSPKPSPNQEQEQEQEQELVNPPISPLKKGGVIGAIGGVEKVGSKPKKPKQPVKTPMPEDFVISDAVRKWANTQGYENLEAHLEYFRNYAMASGKMYANWDAAFRNCVEGDWGKVRERLGGNGTGKPIAPKPKPSPDCLKCHGRGIYPNPTGRGQIMCGCRNPNDEQRPD